MEQNKMLTLGSLFDGSGGFPLGGIISGIAPVWASEIEPFPIRVTTKRLPFMKHYGDVSKLNGAELEPVDIITFGSPCQDMSMAGKRAGLDGNRSGLFYQAIRIIKEMREKTNGERPRYIVWENVPGAYSSNKGEDFRCVLESICQIKDTDVHVPAAKKWQSAGEIMGNDYSIAWRTLDAQYWGVPQRRRRIYLVGDLTGGSAGKILFESEGLSGYSAQGFRSWQGTAAGACKGTAETGCLCLNDQGGSVMGVTKDITATLRAQSTHPPLVFENHALDARYDGPLDVAQTVLYSYGTGGNNQSFVVEIPKTLKIRCGCEGGGKGALIQNDLSATLGTHNDQTLFQPKAYGICAKDSNSMRSDNPHSGVYEATTSRTLDGNGGNPACNQGGMAVVALQGSMIGRKDKNGPQGSGVNEDVSFTLDATDRHAVAYSKVLTASKNSLFLNAQENVADTLVATDYKDPPLVNDKDGSDYIVRRLTPTECARLQGFPDWWCQELGTEDPTSQDMYFWYNVFKTYRDVTNPNGKIKTINQIRKWLKSPVTDAAEYKMWGNGVALPCVVFVLSGIAYYAEEHA